MRRDGNAANTFDDDYEPVRPSMRGNQGQVNEESEHSVPSAYHNFEQTGQSYDEQNNMQGSRQSSSIGMVNRSTRMMAQQNYRMSQGNSRKSNQRSIYDGSEPPSGVPIPQRGTTTDRGSRSGVKNNPIGINNHPSNGNQYYMVNQSGSTKGQNIIPVQKKKGSSSNFVNSNKQMNYVGSLQGSLQDKNGLEQVSY